MCVTYSSTKLSLIISNSPLVFKMSQQFVEIYVYEFWLRNLFVNSNKMSDIKKTKKKLGIIRDNIVDDDVMHSMTSRIMNSMQYFLMNINFSYFSFFHIFYFLNSFKMLAS